MVIRVQYTMISPLSFCCRWTRGFEPLIPAPDTVHAVGGARVVVVGSANVDLVWHGPRLPRPGETVSGGEFVRGFGGKGANQACAAARLGADVVFVGCVGDDDLGAVVRSGLEAGGVDCSHLATAPGEATGVALITVAADGENAIAVVPGANRALSPAAIDAAVEAVAAPDVTLVTGLEIGVPAALTAIVRARAAGMRVVFNPAPYDAAAVDAFGRCDVVIVNEIEAEQYGGTEAVGAGTVVVTLGALGAVARGIRAGRHDGFAVDALDTTGAGDTFVAAYAVTGDLAAACAAGALACRAVGARASQPTLDEVRRLVGDRPSR